LAQLLQSKKYHDEGVNAMDVSTVHFPRSIFYGERRKQQSLEKKH
jgi:hypothetical protein